MRRHLRILDFALSNLARHRAKTAVVVAVYSLLVGLLASLLLYVGALQQEARRLLSSAPEIIGQQLRGGRHELVAVERGSTIRELRGVAAVEPRVWGYSYDPPTAATFTVWGADSVPPGSLELVDGVLAAEPRTCIIGQGVAEIRFLWVGDRLPIKGHDGTLHAPRVAGIFSAGSALLTHDLVVMATADVRRIFGIEQDLATDLAVTVPNPREVATVARKIQRLWPDVRVITRRQILQTYDAVFDWRGGLWVALLLSTILAFAVLVWNQATGLSAEEYRTLGILKAVGWSPRNVLELKLWEGTVVSSAAGLIGLLAAEVHLIVFGGVLFTRVLKGWSALFPAFDVVPDLEVYALLPCLLLAAAPYVAASLVPAWRAAITDPDTVLRS